MATGRIDLSPMAPFDPLSDPSSISQRWRTWKRRFETYLIALNVTDKKQKRALVPSWPSDSCKIFQQNKRQATFLKFLALQKQDESYFFELLIPYAYTDTINLLVRFLNTKLKFVKLNYK